MSTLYRFIPETKDFGVFSLRIYKALLSCNLASEILFKGRYFTGMKILTKGNMVHKRVLLLLSVILLLGAAQKGPLMTMGLGISQRDTEFASYAYKDVGLIARKFGVKLVELTQKDLNYPALASTQLDGLILIYYQGELDSEKIDALRQFESESPQPKVLLWLVKPGFTEQPTTPEGLDAVASPSAEVSAKRAFNGPFQIRLKQIVDAYRNATTLNAPNSTSG